MSSRPPDELLQEERYNLKQYVQVLRRRQWMAAIIFTLVAIPVTLASALRSFAPAYDALTTLWIEKPQTEKVLLDMGSSKNEGFIQILKSRTFAEQVVDSLALTVRLDTREPSLVASLLQRLGLRGDHPVAPLARQEVLQAVTATRTPRPGDYRLDLAGNGTAALWRTEPEGEDSLIASLQGEGVRQAPLNGPGFTLQFTPGIAARPLQIHLHVKKFADAVEDLMANTIVAIDESGNLIQLTVKDGDPLLAADIANTLARRFVAYNLSFKKQQTRTVLQILAEQLDLASRDLAGSEAAIKAYKEQSGIISLSDEVEERINRLAKAEATQQNLAEEKKTLQGFLERARREDGQPHDSTVALEIASYPWSVPDPNLDILRGDLVKLRESKNALALKVTSQHPDLIEVNTKIAQVESDIRQAGERHMQALTAEIANLDVALGQYRGELTRLPQEELNLARLLRETKVNENVYTQVVTRYKEAQIAEAAEIGDVRLLDPALPPEQPTNSRNRTKIMLLGALVGLIMGTFGAIVADYLDTTVKSLEDVKTQLGFPVLGTSPFIRFDADYEFLDFRKAKEIDSILVTHDYSPTPIGEAYRALRTNIMFAPRGGPTRSVVVTSPAPGDGKSFTVSNLAITMAQQGARVLLVDADLRRGVLHNTFACTKTPGLTEILTNRATLLEAVSETHVPNLFLASCGSLIPNPSELLGSLRMKNFLQEAASRFDVIFFDTPPLNHVTDAAVLGSQADAVALVLRAEITDLKEARKSLEILSQVGANVLGIILNAARAPAPRDRYSYYRY